jgi:hypothetical protein
MSPPSVAADSVVAEALELSEAAVAAHPDLDPIEALIAAASMLATRALRLDLLASETGLSWSAEEFTPEEIARAAADWLSALGKETLQAIVVPRLQWLRSMPYDEYLSSTEWRDTREFALKRAGYRCQLCNERARLQVHHRTYERRGFECADDLTVLCRDCHANHHGHR